MPEKKFKRHTITAALPYANGPIHIGHLAGVYVPADIFVRYLRLKGEDVAFICGSDEHGVPITLKAKKEGVSPQQVADKYNQIIKESFEKFGISFDIYSRTSSKTHYQTASDFFKILYDKGIFKEIHSEQYFDEETQSFLADRYIKGTCPNCGFEEAYGDQCENCGTTLSPSELINPKSMLSGSKPVLKETKHWYLPLDQYEDWLREWILKGHKEWKANVYGQCKSWIDQGLQPRAVTRDLDWGVPVPIKGAEGKVLYVWFDAPIGYISATIDWANKMGKNWKDYWQSEDARLIHFIGKDNIVFHCIIFPAMLKTHGDYVLPDNVPANEFLNLESNKISTSRNWAVWLHEYLEEFPGKEDVLRYTLTANMPETKDNDFTWKDFQAKNNSELVAILGNFVNRAVVLTHKFFKGSVPKKSVLFDVDHQLIAQINEVRDNVSKALDQFKFREALSVFMDLSRIGNKYLADTEPWKLIKTDENRVGTILNLSLHVAANISALCEIFLPSTAKKIYDILSIPEVGWNSIGSTDLFGEGHSIGQPMLLFEKIDDDVIEKQVNKLLNTRKMNESEKNADKLAVSPQKEVCTYEDFLKLDLRIAEVIEAERVDKSDKLLKLKVNTGIDVRTVVSGIAKHFKPEEVVGKKVSMVVNLAPRKIMGIESQGMILLAEDENGKLIFVTPESQINSGNKIS